MRFFSSRGRAVLAVAAAGLALTAPAASAADVRTPLSPADQVEMDNAVASARAWIDRTDAAGFGGLYADPDRRVLRVGFTTGATSHADALRRVTGLGDRVEVFEASYTNAHLDALTARIGEDLRRLERELAVDIHMVAADPVHNAVTVGASRADDELLAALRARYGGAVRVEQVNKPQRASRQSGEFPIKGGLEINSPGLLVSYLCTSAFVAQSTGVLQSRYYLVTAGHCANTGDLWSHGAFLIGRQTTDSFYNNSDADGATIAMRQSDISNLVYIYPTEDRPIRSEQALNADYVGQSVCQSGSTSGYVCNAIEHVNTQIDYGDVLLHSQRIGGMVSNFGDSGGPIFFGTSAFGVMSGRSESSDGDVDAIYSHIGHVTRMASDSLASPLRVRTCCS